MGKLLNGNKTGLQFGTWRTFLRIRVGVLCTSPNSATVAEERLAITNFLLLEHGVRVWKSKDVGIMWSVALKPNVQELA